MKKIILLLAICLISITSFAATGGAVTPTINWTLDDEGTLTISGTGNMPDYNFSYNPTYYITSPWYQYRDVITHIKIEDEITNIGNYAFSGLSKTINIEMPNSINKIGNDAFSGCSFENIHIPESVNSIGSKAFGSSGLREIYIPASVQTIENAFWLCSKLETITVDESNQYFSAEDNILYNYDKTVLIFYPISKGNNVIIREGVKEVTSYSIQNTGITSMVIPSSVELFSIFVDLQLQEIFVYWDNILPPFTNFFIGSWNTKLIVPAGTRELYLQSEGWQDFIVIERINTEVTPEIFFNWQSVEGATGYQLIIYSDAEHTNILYTFNFDENGRYIPNQQPARQQFAIFNTENYSHQLTGLENGTYYFSLTALIANEEIIAEQKGSFEINGNSALPAVEKSDINIYVSEKNIVIENALGKNIQIFNTLGQMLANTQNNSEVVQVPVRKTGIYFVKVGLEMIKVVIK